MAFIPDFFSDYQFSLDELSEITSIMAEDDQSNYVRTNDSFSSTNIPVSAISNFSSAMLGDRQDHDNVPISHGHHKKDDALDIFLRESEIMSPIPAVSNSLPETSGILNVDVPTLMNGKMGHSGDIAKMQNFGAGLQSPDVCGFGEDFGEFMPTFTPVSPLSGEKRELEHNQTVPTKSTKTKEVVRYTAEQRKERVLRYLKKKAQRKYKKNIKYASRKTIADRRLRVRGRFVKSNEVFEEETEVKNNDVVPRSHQEKATHCDVDDLQVLLATILEEEC